MPTRPDPAQPEHAVTGTTTAGPSHLAATTPTTAGPDHTRAAADDNGPPHHETAPRAGARQWLALAVLMLPVLLVSIDNTVLAFAVPHLSTALAPTAAQQLWIVDVYSLVLAGLLVTMGTLGDRVGRRRLLTIGAAGFSAVSVYAAFATSADQLIVARALMGIFGATLMPSTLSLLRTIFPDAGQRRLAVAIWAAMFSAGAAAGPLIGGLLLEHFWWGSVFLINVPVLVVLLATTAFLVPESRGRSRGRIDLLSVAMSLAAMLPVVYGIKTLATYGLSLPGAAALVGGIVMGILFVRRQRRLGDPLLDVSLFADRVFSASIGANFMSIFALVGMLFFISQHIQLVLGNSPLVAGIYLLPGTLTAIVMGLAAVALARRLPVGWLIPAGMALTTVGYAVGSTLTASSGGGVLVAAFVLVGAGAGLTETLTNDAILSSVPADRAGAASGISETAYEVGATLGVAVLGSVLAAGYTSRLELPDGLPAGAAEAASQTLGGAANAAETLPPGLAQALMDAAGEAFTGAAATTSVVGAVSLGLASIVVWLAYRGTPAGRREIRAGETA